MVWIQYSLTDGSQTGTNSVHVSDDDLFALGRAQIEYDGDPTNIMVDISQTPPVTVLAPSNTTDNSDLSG